VVAGIEDSNFIARSSNSVSTRECVNGFPFVGAEATCNEWRRFALMVLAQ
jgi:hypothetical protein